MSQENVEVVRRWGASLEAGQLPFDLTDESVRLDNVEQPAGVIVGGTACGSVTCSADRRRRRPA